MKPTLILLLLLAGCTQIIDEKPDGSRLKINTFLNSTEFDKFVHDPNGLQIDKYSGIPVDFEVYFDPLTKSLKAKTKANQIK